MARAGRVVRRVSLPCADPAMRGISDTELICTLNTLHAFNQNADSAIGNGAYTVTVVNNGQPDVQVGGGNADPNYTSTIITSGSTFTVAPY